LTINIPGSGAWSPKNYTKEFKGSVTLTDALKESLNIPAVKLSESVGRENVRKVASDFGIDSDLAAGPALALGASESTLIEMTGAYAGILNGGSSVTPYGLVELRLLGDREPLMGTGGGIKERVIRENAAGQLIYMMERVVSQGTGRRAALADREAAGKTGTTQAARDAWFIGFTADYVAGVWMGYDDNTPLTGVTGGGLPAEIWHEVMTRVHQGLPSRPLPMIAPAPITNAQSGSGDFEPIPANDVADTVLQRVLRSLGGNGSSPTQSNGDIPGTSVRSVKSKLIPSINILKNLSLPVRLETRNVTVNGASPRRNAVVLTSNQLFTGRTLSTSNRPPMNSRNRDPYFRDM